MMVILHETIMIDLNNLNINFIIISGLNFFYRKFEHLIPKFLNKKWRKKHTFNVVNGNIENFQKYYREKIHNAKRKSKK